MSNNHPLKTFHYCPRCGSEMFRLYDEKSNRCEQCGFHLYHNASASVAAIIVNEQGELLLCKRAKEPQKGLLDLPGGFVDMNESAEAALKREIKEELGVEIIGSDYYCSLPNRYLFSDFVIHTLDLFYIVRIDTTCKISCADDVADYGYYALNAINVEDIGLESIRKVVQLYIQQNKK